MEKQKKCYYVVIEVKYSIDGWKQLRILKKFRAIDLFYWVGQKVIWVFWFVLQKNTNELWGQPNTIVKRALKANGRKKVKVKSLSSVQLFATPWR